MLRISFTILLALTAWIHPATALASILEPPQENAQFINYQKIREQNARNSEQSKFPQTLRPKSDSVGKPRPAIGNGQSQQHGGRHYSKEEVQELIKQYSATYGISAESPLCIAKLESGYNQFSKNKSSSASGVFQYIAGTWAKTDEGISGLSVFDAEANVKAAIKYMASRKSAKPWTVAKNCPPVKTIN